ncbi:lactococcin 972 family bacteriocin [Corynebacterium uropygiale]|uniref:lactococcin 972 family bacteriocin n=1 Tax=Corynebacterium uropygiale TaxID=1775911 RepID=UPI003B82F21C
MRSRFAKQILVGVMSCCLVGAGVASAEAVAGGEWDHGNSGGRVWSNFFHPTAAHGSSVQGHQYVDSGCVAPNVWARAQSHSKYLPGADGAYYRFCTL